MELWYKYFLLTVLANSICSFVVILACIEYKGAFRYIALVHADLLGASSPCLCFPFVLKK